MFSFDSFLNKYIGQEIKFWTVSKTDITTNCSINNNNNNNITEIRINMYVHF